MMFSRVSSVKILHNITAMLKKILNPPTRCQLIDSTL